MTTAPPSLPNANPNANISAATPPRTNAWATNTSRTFGGGSPGWGMKQNFGKETVGPLGKETVGASGSVNGDGSDVKMESGSAAGLGKDAAPDVAGDTAAQETPTSEVTSGVTIQLQSGDKQANTEDRKAETTRTDAPPLNRKSSGLLADSGRRREHGLGVKDSGRRVDLTGDGEGETTMKDLLNRLVRTETLLTTLSTHVSQLARVVLDIQKTQRAAGSGGVSPTTPLGGLGASLSAGAIDLATLSPNDGTSAPPGLPLPSPLPLSLLPITTNPGQTGSLTTSSEIANLTTQISALSASVAQLQRLQTQGQSQLTTKRSLDLSTGAGRGEKDVAGSGSVLDGGNGANVLGGADQGSFKVQTPGQGAFSNGTPQNGQVTPGTRSLNGNGTYFPAVANALPIRPGTQTTNGNGYANRGPPTPGGVGTIPLGSYGGGFASSAAPRGRPALGARGISANMPSLSMNLNGIGFGLNGQQPLVSPAGSLSHQMLLSGLGSPNISSLVSGAAANQAGQSLGSDWTNASTPQSVANHQQLAAAVMGMTTGPPGLAGLGGMASFGNGMISPGPGGFRESGPQTPGGGMKDPSGMAITKWDSLALSPEVLRQIAKYGIGPPNKIQARSLPFMLRGSDVIAQAPPTLERIITYVIPVIQLCLNLGLQQSPYKGPNAIIVTTTVDQANQAHKLIRDLGLPLGVRSHLAVGAVNADITNDLKAMHQNSVQVVIGTPGRVHDVFVKHANNGGLSGGEARMLVLDEVDQLIARNLYEYVLALVKVLPTPRSRSRGPSGTPSVRSPGVTSPYDAGMQSPFNPASTTPFPTAGRGGVGHLPSEPAERQTCIFSNTIPTDVINFSQSIQVHEPVRVLVRREGINSNHNDSSTAGNLRHYYLYLALATASSNSGTAAQSGTSSSGPGTIGSGRAVNGNSSGVAGQVNTEANQAKEWKLEALADVLAEYPLWQAIVHVGSPGTLEAVVAKLHSRQMETLSLHSEMTPTEKQITIAKWKVSAHTQRGARFLVVLDLVVKGPEVVGTGLVVNFDLPRSVEGYAQRVAAAAQPNNVNSTNNTLDPNVRRLGPPGPTPRDRERERETSQPPPSVILNFIQAAGGDVEMLRSIECAFRLKCSEVPSSLRDLF